MTIFSGEYGGTVEIGNLKPLSHCNNLSSQSVRARRRAHGVCYGRKTMTAGVPIARVLPVAFGTPSAPMRKVTTLPAPWFSE
jgi:hypothetical protein